MKSTTKPLALLPIFLVSTSLMVDDWRDIPLPAPLDEGQSWELQEAYSDSFNYTGKGDEFSSKWNDTYYNITLLIPLIWRMCFGESIGRMSADLQEQLKPVKLQILKFRVGRRACQSEYSHIQPTHLGMTKHAH
ncbi:hypothetical protein M3916_004069 [Vibrio parahaemolyticus]|uniref:hypothetical protein n=1 Tax=Vibrio fluvialis TaxID=676 RepID=UPI00159AB404|nr:hypothetical protein [Vibrio fluvialis]EJE4163893.1 hypothetical protein [Vibrio parahaemolyticus]QKE35852.1 hypothetical protein HPK20_15155 [Vibrio fluvialis]